MSQTNYSMSQDTAVAGQLYGVGPQTILTYNNPVDAILFGVAVAKVSADANGIEKPDSSGAVIVGVAVRDPSIEYDPDAENQFEALSDVPVLRRGQIYVYCEEAVTPDDDVYVRHTANGGLTVLGAFRNDNDGGNALALSTAKFLTSAGIGGYAVLDLNIA